jgi:hypothetical protein
MSVPSTHQALRTTPPADPANPHAIPAPISCSARDSEVSQDRQERRRESRTYPHRPEVPSIERSLPQDLPVANKKRKRRGRKGGKELSTSPRLACVRRGEQRTRGGGWDESRGSHRTGNRRSSLESVKAQLFRNEDECNSRSDWHRRKSTH